MTLAQRSPQHITQQGNALPQHQTPGVAVIQPNDHSRVRLYAAIVIASNRPTLPPHHHLTDLANGFAPAETLFKAFAL